MFPPYGLRVAFKRTNAAVISHLPKRYFKFDDHVEDFRRSRRDERDPFEAFKPAVKEKPNEPPIVSDPLEFRNIGKYKKSTNVPFLKLDLINKNSIFYEVKSKSFLDTMKNIVAKTKIKDQSYNPDRVRTLGPDLAAAHFFVCRGGGVKFVGGDKFIRGEINKSYLVLPDEKDPNYKVEAIDFAKGDFVYEALSNLTDLKYLTWISMRNNTNVNNWFLDHLSSLAPSLEYLDIKGCKGVNKYGLSCFYRFQKLKCVNVEGISDSTDFILSCLTLEAEIPNLIFVGLQFKPSPKSVFSDSV